MLLRFSSVIGAAAALLALSMTGACGNHDDADASSGAALSGADDSAAVSCPEGPTMTPADKTALANITTVAETCVNVPPPDPGPTRSFTHFEPELTSFAPQIHRGRDSFYAVGEPQWALGKFSYGLEFDLVDEEVDIWVLRGCSGTWEKLGTTRTTKPHDHATVEGVEDDGARVFFQIPDDKKLDVGRHRIRMVVAGDNTATDQYVEVLPRGTPLLVSDVDGTLTERLTDDIPLVCDEESDFPALARALIGDGPAQPKLHEGASKAFQTIASAGYRPIYLTARPEFLVGHTRNFLRESARQDGRGDLPQGIVHTTLSLTGALNSAAETFKQDELSRLAAKGFKLQFGFGNRPSDVAAYDANNVPLRFFFENLDTVWRMCTAVGQVTLLPSPFAAVQTGDFRIKSYTDLEPAFDKLQPVCPKP